MTELTYDNVEKILFDCLFKDDIPEEELKQKAVIVEGILHNWGFVPEKITEHKAEIVEMLSQLPDEFMKTKGGGMSFLNACVRKDGVQWGEHQSMDKLFALGQAAGVVKCLMPRLMWQALPGGMPYYGVDL